MAEHHEVRRPPLAFRVGVAGPQDLPAATVEGLRRELHKFFLLLYEELTLASNNHADVYAEPQTDAGFTLRLVSQLAEGADRLVAEVAEEFGADLYAPLPFAKAEYEQDFPQSVAQFRKMIEKAQVLELDGAHEAARDSHEEADRFVLRNCDLLVALWDGEMAHGWEGTDDIVAVAAETRTPVWLIDPRGARPPELISRAFELRHREHAPTGLRAERSLRDWLRKTLAPPPLSHRQPGGPFGFFAEAWRRATDERQTPLEEFYGESPRSNWFFWRSFSTLMHLLASPARQAPQRLDLESPAPMRESKAWWRELHQTADYYSLAYGDRYRSSYVLIAFLAVTALAMASLAGEFSRFRQVDAALAEVVLIFAIGALVIFNHRRRWHEKWLSYRLLAELCRKQFVLTGLGRRLPGGDVDRVASEAYESEDEEQSPPDAWVCWYYAAALRAAPPLEGDMRTIKVEAYAEGRRLVAEQLHYHRDRRRRNHLAGARLALFGETFFLATLAVGFVKVLALIQNAEDVAHWIAAAGIIVSAVSAAFVGIRAYSEFTLLARQSAHLLRVLKEAGAELDAIVVDRPLASRDLGRCLFALATAMMQDIASWAQTFRIKVVEAG